MYNKIILTIIAVCLVVLTLSNLELIPNAYASSENKQMNSAMLPLAKDGSLLVRFSPDSEMDVNITSISTNDELDVNIDEVGGGFVPFGALPVKLESNGIMDINIKEVSGYAVGSYYGKPIPVTIKE